MPRNNTDPRVDAYIDALPEWQQAICRRVRDLAHAADPALTETIKRTRQPYFVLEGNVCALLVAKEWVNVFVYDGAIVPDPHGIITGGHGNKTALYRRDSPRREAQRARPYGDVAADHREQSRRWLEKGEVCAVVTDAPEAQTAHEMTLK